MSSVKSVALFPGAEHPFQLVVAVETDAGKTPLTAAKERQQDAVFEFLKNFGGRE